jgi:hypothetical protein
MIKLELEIRDSEELRATAQYLTQLAEIHERRERSWREEQKAYVFPTTAQYGQVIAGGVVTGVQAVPETAPPETVPAEKRRARREREAVVTKQPKAETEQPEPETEQPKAETEKGASAKAPTLETIRAKAAALSQAGQGTSLRALMKKYGASNLTSLSAEQYPSFMNELEAMEVTDA